jgi:hypothetical protein
LLGALARALRPLEVDLLRTLGGLGQHDHVIGVHLGEAADHGEVVFVAAAPVHEVAGGERREKRRMTRQHAEVAFGAGRHHLVHLARHEETSRRGELKLHQAASCIFRAFSWTSSIPPTM